MIICTVEMSYGISKYAFYNIEFYRKNNEILKILNSANFITFY